MDRRFLVSATLMVGILAASPFAIAETPAQERREQRQEIRQEHIEHKKEMRKERKEHREHMKEMRHEHHEQMKEMREKGGAQGAAPAK